MTVQRTIAFVDLAGFTALTDVHGDHAAVDLVDDFTGIATEAATAGEAIGEVQLAPAGRPLHG